jgi:hypothetical protein
MNHPRLEIGNKRYRKSKNIFLAQEVYSFHRERLNMQANNGQTAYKNNL